LQERGAGNMSKRSAIAVDIRADVVIFQILGNCIILNGLMEFSPRDGARQSTGFAAVVDGQ